MPARSNADVARVLARMAIMLEMDEANTFRVRAYENAARALETLAEPVGRLAAEAGALEALPGIGKDLAQKIRDIVETGTTGLHDELADKYPAELVSLTDLQGLGAKRVRQLHDALGIHDRASLEAAAQAGKLSALPGFGAKLEQKVLHSLSISGSVMGRMLLSSAWPVAHAITERLRAVPTVARVEIAGSFRRRKETVRDLDVLVCGGAPEAVMNAFTSFERVAEVMSRGETKASVRLTDGLQVDLRVLGPESFGAALLYFTGSKEHNIELRRVANDQGMTLNEYGLAREKDGMRVASRTEHEIYRALGMDWIPPELREARGEIGLAREGCLPRLLEIEDLKGDLHMHTTRSDGRHSLTEMVQAAKNRGYAYCAITEHSKALAMAGGFDEARVRRSVEEIEAVRREVPGIQVLHGLEVDILADGSLDLDDEALDLLDWVVVSLHSRLDQPSEAATPRVLKALEHPAVCALGHPTNRMIGTREGTALDLERIFERAAELGVAMEINSQPDRVDLNDVHARLARDKGADLVIDTDAHSMANLDYIRYGVFAARRAGLTKNDILNAQPWGQMRRSIRKSRAPGREPARPSGAAPERRTVCPVQTPEAAKPARKPAKPAAKKAAPKKAAVKKAARRKTAPKKAPAKKTASARKPSAKKAPAKKTVVRKGKARRR